MSKEKGLKALCAYRQLRGLDLITEKEFRMIGKRIFDKYGEHLHAIRDLDF